MMCPYEKRRRHRHGGEGTKKEAHEKSDVEFGVMLPQVKEHLEPLEGKGGKKKFPPEPKGNVAL